MLTLLEVQRAMQGRLMDGDASIVAMLADGVVPDRLDIYRNTVLLTLTKVLRLCYPAVSKLVGEDFFNGAAEIFAAGHLPQAAYLDQYGGDFPEFLRGFEPARALVYLADVARLEWAVNGALHAPDAVPLDMQALATVEADNSLQVRLVPHPCVRWLRASYPADEIWCAVVNDDDRALGTIDLGAGPAHLLVERNASGVAVLRLDEATWRFGERLGRGEFLQAVIDTTPGIDATVALAEYLGLGRFTALETAPNHAGRMKESRGAD